MAVTCAPYDSVNNDTLVASVSGRKWIGKSRKVIHNFMSKTHRMVIMSDVISKCIWLLLHLYLFTMLFMLKTLWNLWASCFLYPLLCVECEHRQWSIFVPLQSKNPILPSILQKHAFNKLSTRNCFNGHSSFYQIFSTIHPLTSCFDRQIFMFFFQILVYLYFVVQ